MILTKSIYKKFKMEKCVIIDVKRVLTKKIQEQLGKDVVSIIKNYCGDILAVINHNINKKLSSLDELIELSTNKSKLDLNLISTVFSTSDNDDDDDYDNDNIASELISKIHIHLSNLLCIVVSNDKRYVCTSSESDYNIIIWEKSCHKYIYNKILRGGDLVVCLAFQQETYILIGYSKFSSIRRWNIISGECCGIINNENIKYQNYINKYDGYCCATVRTTDYSIAGLADGTTTAICNGKYTYLMFGTNLICKLLNTKAVSSLGKYIIVVTDTCIVTYSQFNTGSALIYSSEDIPHIFDTWNETENQHTFSCVNLENGLLIKKRDVIRYTSLVSECLKI